MSISDEIGRDWVKRLCALQLDYTKRLDLLATEYIRMPNAEQAAVKTALGGDGFILSLTGLPDKVMRTFAKEREVKHGIGFLIGDVGVTQDMAALTTRHIPLEALADTIRILGIGAHTVYKEKAEGPLLAAIAWVGETLLAKRWQERADDAIQALAKKAQA